MVNTRVGTDMLVFCRGFFLFIGDVLAPDSVAYYCLSAVLINLFPTLSPSPVQSFCRMLEKILIVKYSVRMIVRSHKYSHPFPITSISQASDLSKFSFFRSIYCIAVNYKHQGVDTCYVDTDVNISSVVFKVTHKLSSVGPFTGCTFYVHGMGEKHFSYENNFLQF